MTEMGGGLNLLIKCHYLPHHNWMAFSSWYSVTKNLPDAKMLIYCDKSQTAVGCALFDWVRKVGASFSYKNNAEYNAEIFCDTMAIRKLWTTANVGEAKSEDIVTFCSYKNGCGNFVMSDWINSVVPPFDKTDSFDVDGMSINEQKILELWRKVSTVYSAIV